MEITDVLILGNVHNIDSIKFDNKGFYILVKNLYDNDYWKYNTLYFDNMTMSKKLKMSIYSDGEISGLEYEYSLQELFQNMQFEAVDSFKDHTGEIDTRCIVPLFYIQSRVDTLQIYSQLRFCDNEMIFIRTGEIPNGAEVKYSDVIDKAVELHARNNVFLGNHQCYYRKEDDTKEIEYKFNILDKSDPWILINEIIKDIHMQKVDDFVFEFKDEYQKWDYMNHMFKIYGDESQAGYISFIPQTNGKYLIKRKIYTQDQLSRTEIHYKNVNIEIPLDEYVEKTFHSEYKQFPPFRRIRYDINIECLKTGNIHGIFFDYITVEGKPQVLKQCEIEYLRTRSLFHNDKHKEELSILKNYMVKFFEQRNIEFLETFYSKLSFMEEVCKK